MATWPRQPLVLVNETAGSTGDLLAFKRKIVDSVHARFGIALSQGAGTATLLITRQREGQCKLRDFIP